MEKDNGHYGSGAECGKEDDGDDLGCQNLTRKFW